MRGAAYERVQSSETMPGALILRPGISIGEAIEEILIVAMCAVPEEIQNRVVFLPLSV
jgi:hypothetical protein